MGSIGLRNGCGFKVADPAPPDAVAHPRLHSSKEALAGGVAARRRSVAKSPIPNGTGLKNQLEPAIGLEPMTPALRERCSTN